ncbi:MAG: four-carbon acid sugar kinase family protein [Chloroflexota bacterium]|nr:four-carbon acid sugar kinase family protein [Chloroflexota bacterium]
MEYNKLAIISDDLTGAMDSSGSLAAKGFNSSVIFNLNSIPDTDSVAVSTDSRDGSASNARIKVADASRKIGPRIIYKKIDSTLRGHIGIELKSMMDSMKIHKVLVAPAFPDTGKTTINGTMLVNGFPVHKSSFANDPTNPVSQSHIPTLLAGSMQYSVDTLSLDVISKGSNTIRNHMRTNSHNILVCDAIEQKHLQSIADAISNVGEKWIICGSGGLAREMGVMLGTKFSDKAICFNPRSGTSLIVIGSLHEKTVLQFQSLQNSRDIPVLTPSSVDNFSSLKTSIVITSVNDKYLKNKENSVAKSLAKATASALDNMCTGLFLSGGSTAAAVLGNLQPDHISLVGEVEPGVPAGNIIGGKADGLRVVTKAGGFGSTDAILNALRYLEHGTLN